MKKNDRIKNRIRFFCFPLAGMPVPAVEKGRDSHPSTQCNLYTLITPTTMTDLSILSTDVLGRVHTPVDQRDALMDAFERSGLSGAQFARLHGLRHSTFAHWRQRLKKLRSAKPGEARPLFEEVDVCSARQASAGLCISLPGGARVTIDRGRSVSGRCGPAELSGALMLSFTGALKVFVALDPQDMRKRFNGLSAAVSEHLQCDPYQGALYLFTNRRHDARRLPA